MIVEIDHGAVPQRALLDNRAVGKGDAQTLVGRVVVGAQGGTPAVVSSISSGWESAKHLTGVTEIDSTRIMVPTVSPSA